MYALSFVDAERARVVEAEPRMYVSVNCVIIHSGNGLFVACSSPVRFQVII